MTKRVTMKQQRDKVIKDLVDFAVEFRQLRDAITIHPSGIDKFLLVDEMSRIVLETFTKKEESDNEEILIK